ncbi:DUF7660 family protein [Paenibacillus radicis (ex Xue et al. 2023)]|uniref:DUF7660 domain-containing protein n=1 Tax=Paenibacillus radicis (ex Xue et al. 2023) TaxID=2972489 RepID=A0ABT1YF80_9BACL|nr:hypothetical protein [Paenibacillus radicis (ex Xue et al. 2023)]MCR8630883.1 hypothetical protein [Paenibacillus radicis (ex Xue et al. 2023)]
MNLYEQCDAVKTKDDLMIFIQVLRNDLQTNNDEWENITLEHYLESIEAWITDTTSLPNEPNWKSLAQIMYAGKVYE